MAQSTPTSTTGEGYGTSHSTSIQHPNSSSIPVEMSEIDTSQKASGPAAGGLNDVPIPVTSPIEPSFDAAQTTTTSPAEAIAGKESKRNESSDLSASKPTSEPSKDPLSTSNPESNTTVPDSTPAPDVMPPAISRLDSVAIGPSTDESPSPLTTEIAGPVLVITLLLTSGARHPYKIDERYLAKRNVEVPETTEAGKKDPFSISVYTLKELILREWREEWEAAPSSPSSIRLIYFGRLLDDKSPLRDCRFNTETANVVHMTVRPQDIVDDEEASKGKTAGRERGETESEGGCRCVIL